VYNRAYVSGGSSSGSAVVVAANVVAFALGTDTAGSGRVPAAFNGLVGLKPTLGRWSTTGVVPACRSLDCVTVLARTVEDAKLVDGVCAGYDEADVYSRRVTPAARAKRDTQVRIGVARPDQLNFSGDAESAALDELARARLSEARATVVEVDIAPLLAAAQLLYNGPWVAERTAAIGPFVHTHPGAVHPVVRGIVEGGRGVTGVDTFRAMYALKRAVRHAEALWEDVDVLALPTAPTIYRISEVLADPVTLNSTLGRYTNFVNLLDMAAIAIPAGFRKNHTGYGITLIGPAGSDEALQSLAGKLAPLLGAGITPDLDIAPAAKTVALAVVGAHLSGMPLHHQLTSRAARLARRAHTEPAYRLYAMAGTTPPKPALVHVGAGGVQIELEVYELGLAEFGSFVEEVPPPLAIGTVTLSDGCTVKGFVAEPRALQGATDVSSFGGWRAYIASR
jgi:allophanate hydrolase